MKKYKDEEQFALKSYKNVKSRTCIGNVSFYKEFEESKVEKYDTE
jgi:hypothetical protein